MTLLNASVIPIIPNGKVECELKFYEEQKYQKHTENTLFARGANQKEFMTLL